MDHQADSDGVSGHFAAADRVAAEHLRQGRSVTTDIPERLPVLQGESELVLQHIGDVLANIFGP